MEERSTDVAILGGGPAGLGVHYYAHQKGLDSLLIEATSQLGGNCRTESFGDFRCDTGAHRLHDKDERTTALFQELLGSDLQSVSAPSQIFVEGRFTDFPLSPLNLWKTMGTFSFFRACIQVLENSVKRTSDVDDFESLAVGQYGRIVAERFLINYSEKLWGDSADNLSVEIAGSRLKGLDLKTFILEALRGKKKKVEHLDGTFYYPRYGIGMLFDALVEAVPTSSLLLESPVTEIRHENFAITEVISNGQCVVRPELVVSTLPMTTLLRCLQPAPPAAVLEALSRIRFRDVLVLVFALSKPSVNANASMYFPDKKFRFTRVYEPRNRSQAMAPDGQTSLAVEVPCQNLKDWTDEAVRDARVEVQRQLVEIGFFRETDVLNCHVMRLRNAYPILDNQYKEHTERAFEYVRQFRNLRITGRNGLVEYSHIHDHMKNARKLVDGFVPSSVPC